MHRKTIIMRAYNLGFITDENIFNHVKETVKRFSDSINLADLNKNIIDPIKLTFDAKVYGRSIEDVIAAECIRQMDKSNNNHIGYFHQNLFRYAGNGWTVPKEGFDVVNEERHIYALLNDDVSKMKTAIKNKVVMKFMNQLMKDEKAICMIVDLANYSYVEKSWSIDGEDGYFDDKFRYISINGFYEVVFGKTNAYKQIVDVLPVILSDI